MFTSDKLKTCLEALSQKTSHPDVMMWYQDMLHRGLSLQPSPIKLNNYHSVPDSFALSPLLKPELNKTDWGSLAVIKMNGGLGTTMGCKGPKSLLEITKGKRFIDVIFEDIKVLREDVGVQIPFGFMNSSYTHEATLAEIPDNFECFNFQQHVFPRLDVHTLTPFLNPTQPESEWYPPGHGEFYLALHTSGMLKTLLDKGVKTVFISNSDNIAATVDESIYAAFLASNSDFMMEVTPKTEKDIKGGIVCERNGRLFLIERSQIQESDDALFCNTDQFPYFNTNSLWINLEKVNNLMAQHALKLPVIHNKKEVDGQSVLQLETAIGSAISSFSSPKVMVVSRDRFKPVKTMADLEALKKSF